jgi:hypothetical protein
LVVAIGLDFLVGFANVAYIVASGVLTCCEINYVRLFETANGAY